MLIEDHLDDGGFEVLGPMPSCAEALAWLRGNTPDLALIDYMLADGPCLDLARELKRRGVPFAVLSGYDERVPRADPAFAGTPWLDKPMTQEALHGVIAGLIPRP